jgi:hypothetical protein
MPEGEGTWTEPGRAGGGYWLRGWNRTLQPLDSKLEDWGSRDWLDSMPYSLGPRMCVTINRTAPLWPQRNWPFPLYNLWILWSLLASKWGRERSGRLGQLSSKTVPSQDRGEVPLPWDQHSTAMSTQLIPSRKHSWWNQDSEARKWILLCSDMEQTTFIL